MPYSAKNQLLYRFAFLLVAALFLVGCNDEGSGLMAGTSSDPDVSNDQQPAADGSGMTGNALLSWSAPGHRQNGESLHLIDVQHYVIYFSQDESTLLENSIIVTDNNSGSMSHDIEDLGEGEWFFAIRSVDSDGLQSPLSDVVTKTI